MTTKNKNILVLSAGRRVELVQDFQKEAAKFSDGIKVYTTDLNPKMSSACQTSDGSFQVPRIDSEDYIDSIFKLAQKQNIGLIVPTIDTELQKLADAREQFADAGITIVVSDSDFIRICRDKRATITLFNKLGINTPAIYDRNNIQFPCFVKPYDGSRAVGAKMLKSAEELTNELLTDPKMMFCQLIDIKNTFKEFTVDMYYDRSGRLKCTVPRERLEVRSGEVSKGATRRGKLYDTLIEKMAVVKGARGCLTVQFFYHEESNTLYGVEINPRFGGGFPLTYACGANYLGWLIKEYLYGEEIPSFDQWQNNLIMLRYDAKILVSE
ncbi:ATP-grasp domain-containing protein [Neisseria weaveri]|uniref:Protein Pglb2 n=1 Tax=Neisseria weaveri TaxID=28091 RepID=A0A448VPA2_9NEIS|nr:ATP-grasp domain-containing protein [Neisseria weaveri]EGV37387.1 CarB protein [Neisseria weaveri LMG 5135]VEJ51626.1 protein Pglb2 [Neisseria weaveri]